MQSLKAEMLRGVKKKMTLEVGEGYSLPLWIICGEEEGQTLVVTAGVHGCEYVGIQTAKALYEELNPKDLRGNLVILPLINQEGFYAGAKQVFPRDNKNLNREFPGSSQGSLTQKVASCIEEVVYPEADFILDLHGGDINEAMTPLVFFPVDAEETVKAKARQAAMHLPVGYRIPSTSKNGLYSYAVQRGIPGLLLEIGGRGRWSQEEVALCKSSVGSILSFLKIIEGPGINQAQKESQETVYDEASGSAFWFSEIGASQPIAEGDLLGQLRDLDDQLIRSYYASFDGLVLYCSESLGVQEGDLLVAYARL